jgi:hypothetical protein
MPPPLKRPASAAEALGKTSKVLAMAMSRERSKGRKGAAGRPRGSRSEDGNLAKSSRDHSKDRGRSSKGQDEEEKRRDKVVEPPTSLCRVCIPHASVPSPPFSFGRVCRRPRSGARALGLLGWGPVGPCLRLVVGALLGPACACFWAWAGALL